MISQLDRDVYQVIKNQFPIAALEIIDVLQLESEYSDIGFGRLYPSLNWLDKHGFISWEWADTESPRRKYYSPRVKCLSLGGDVQFELVKSDTVIRLTGRALLSGGLADMSHDPPLVQFDERFKDCVFLNIQLDDPSGDRFRYLDLGLSMEQFRALALALSQFLGEK